MDLDSISVHKHELGQYPPILTSHLVNNSYLYLFVCGVLWVINHKTKHKKLKTCNNLYILYHKNNFSALGAQYKFVLKKKQKWNSDK